jgi:hypothetical protein
LSYCLRVLHVCSDILTLSFQFYSRFSCPFNFLMTICSLCILMSHRSAVTLDTACLIFFVSCVLSFRLSLRFCYFSLLFSLSNFYFTSQ